MNVTLKAVDKSNWLACTQLEISDRQKETFPSPVVYWIAESKVETSFVPMAVYADDLLVGFMVYGQDPDDGEYWLIALLIDQKHQRRGYARAAIQELIRHLKDTYGCQKLTLGHRPQNREAETLYLSLGFEQVDVSETEVIRSLFLK